MEEKRKREAEKRTYEEEQVFCTVLCIFQKLTSKELSQRMKLLKIVVGLSLNEAVSFMLILEGKVASFILQ